VPCKDIARGCHEIAIVTNTYRWLNGNKLARTSEGRGLDTCKPHEMKSAFHSLGCVGTVVKMDALHTALQLNLTSVKLAITGDLAPSLRVTKKIFTDQIV